MFLFLRKAPFSSGAFLFLLFLGLLGVGGCATPLFDPADDIHAMATKGGLLPLLSKTTTFTVAGFHSRRPLQNGEVLRVYIEGDGNAWRSRRRVSDDPTPLTPTALAMAVQDPSLNVLYLARPCQVVRGRDRRNCDSRYWTSARFAPEVVMAIDEAISQYTSGVQDIEISLVGYSGGGAIATILAATRKDVVELITVAGTLDHEAWTHHHNVSSLSGSLNARDFAARTAQIKQDHFWGARDDVVPEIVYRGYAKMLPLGHQARGTQIPRFGHQCCWAEQWLKVLSLVH